MAAPRAPPTNSVDQMPPPPEDVSGPDDRTASHTGSATNTTVLSSRESAAHESAAPNAAVTTAATFCATLVDEWVRSGVTHAFVAPGSRSTPLALALAARHEIDLSVFHDERSASFAALGAARASGRPTIVLCSSGTAAAHVHAGVIEADLSAVPMIACTADRPPELWGIGAPQTVDQTHLFGRSVRWFAEPGPPEEATLSTWRSLGSQAAAEAQGWSGQPGPAHLNLSFRDPLTGRAGPLPPGRANGAPWHDVSARAAERALGPAVTKGLIVAGGGLLDPASVINAAETLNWPLIADPRSGCRTEDSISYADLLLRSADFRAAARPDAIIRFGEPMASKVLSQWTLELTSPTADEPVPLIVAAAGGRWRDPERAAAVVRPEHEILRTLLAHRPGAGGPWRQQWQTANGAVDDALNDVSRAMQTTSAENAAPPTTQGGTDNTAPPRAERSLLRADPFIVRRAMSQVPSGAAVVAASSMAVRELEWFTAPRPDVAVFANRGANGIDGTVATAIGVARTGRPTLCVVGDVAFLHDATSLTALADRHLDLTILVIDNDGGGIFGFLPQHDLVEPTVFEQLFGTPHATDLAALAAAHGLPCRAWTGDLPPIGGVSIVLAQTDRQERLRLQGQIDAAVSARIADMPVGDMPEASPQV